MRRIAELLELDVPEELWPALVEAATFESMKRHADQLAPEVDNGAWHNNTQFFHKGTSGQWADVLSRENLDFYDKVKVDRMGLELTVWMEQGSGSAAGSVQ
jgi:hypothetical protein